MKVFILGSGTLLSAPDRNPSGYLLVEKEEPGLMDCGPGILRRLKETNTDLLALKTIFLTHFHVDHCADVLALLLTRYLLDSRANEHLRIIGPKGLTDWFRAQASWQGEWLNAHPPELIEMTAQPFHWAGLTIRSCKTLHTERSIGYVIEDGKGWFYSGDTDYSEKLIRCISGLHTAIIECSLPEGMKMTGHLVPAEVAMLAQKAGFKRLILTHLYPFNERPELVEEVAEHFQGEIIVARDFQQFS